LTAEEWQVGLISIGEESARRALGKGYWILPSINSLGLEMCSEHELPQDEWMQVDLKVERELKKFQWRVMKYQGW
jgi:hypothetical protein